VHTKLSANKKDGESAAINKKRLKNFPRRGFV